MKRSRRSFLRAAGATTAAGAAASLFPWLRAAGQPTARVPKLAILYFPHGTIWDRWRPSAGDWTDSYILSPLAPHRDRVAVIDGLRIADQYAHRVPHTFDSPMVLTGSPIDTTSTEYYREDHDTYYGWNTGTSIDQTIADRLAPTTPFRTLELGVACGGAHPGGRLIYRGPRVWRDPIDQPQRAWDQVFAGFENPERDQDALRRRSVLDAVLSDLEAIKPRLSAADRLKLDAHATGLREIEQSFADVGALCEAPARPLNAGLELDIDTQLGLMASALACGQTRIASLQVRRAENDGSPYPWVGITTGGHHLTSHGRTNVEFDLLAELYRWYMARVAGFLARLAATPDGDGYTLLDNTMVCVVSELGIGWNHNQDNIPFLVAGGGAGRLRSGYLDLRASAPLHNRLLVSMANVMGIEDIQSYGSWDDAAGPVPGLLNPL